MRKKMYSHDNNSWLSPLTFLEEKKPLSHIIFIIIIIITRSMEAPISGVIFNNDI